MFVLIVLATRLLPLPSRPLTLFSFKLSHFSPSDGVLPLGSHESRACVFVLVKLPFPCLTDC